MNRKFIYVVLITLLLFPLISLSQPMPYDPSIGGGAGAYPAGGGAPLSEGLVIMLILGAAFALKKVYKVKKQFVHKFFINL